MVHILGNAKFNWFNKPFIKCENVFVGWENCKEVLEAFCEGITGWSLDVDEKGIDIGLSYPTVEVDDNAIPMVNLFPLEHQSKVIEICQGIHKDYLPDMNKFFKEMEDEGELTTDKVMAYVNAHNNDIGRRGGRTVIKELRYRLGISGWITLEKPFN